MTSIVWVVYRTGFYVFSIFFSTLFMGLWSFGCMRELMFTNYGLTFGTFCMGVLFWTLWILIAVGTYRICLTITVRKRWLK